MPACRRRGRDRPRRRPARRRYRATRRRVRADRRRRSSWVNRTTNRDDAEIGSGWHLSWCSRSDEQERRWFRTRHRTGPSASTSAASGIKGAVVDTTTGELVTERKRIPTPQPSTPDAVAEVVAQLVAEADWTGPVGATFPAVIQHGVARSAANVDHSWIGTDVDDDLHQGRRARQRGRRPQRRRRRRHRRGALRRRQGRRRRRHPADLRHRHRQRPAGERHARSEHRTRAISNSTATTRRRAPPRRSAKSERHVLQEVGQARQPLHEPRRALFTPDLFVVGGGVSKNADKWVPLLELSTPVEPAQLLNDAGIVGAAMAADRTPRESSQIASAAAPSSRGSRATGSYNVITQGTAHVLDSSLEPTNRRPADPCTHAARITCGAVLAFGPCSHVCRRKVIREFNASTSSVGKPPPSHHSHPRRGQCDPARDDERPCRDDSDPSIRQGRRSPAPAKAAPRQEGRPRRPSAAAKAAPAKRRPQPNRSRPAPTSSPAARTSPKTVVAVESSSRPSAVTEVERAEGTRRGRDRVHLGRRGGVRGAAAGAQGRRDDRVGRLGPRLPQADRQGRAAQRRGGGRPRQADRGRPLRRRAAAPGRGGRREARPADAAATCAGSSATASGPRTTCWRPTCAWSSRWPSATPAAAWPSSTSSRRATSA